MNAIRWHLALGILRLSFQVMPWTERTISLGLLMLGVNEYYRGQK